jgi:dihydroorotase
MSSVNTSGRSLKITGGRLFDGQGAEQENTALLIRDGRIAAIGEAAAREQADETTRLCGPVL